MLRQLAPELFQLAPELFTLGTCHCQSCVLLDEPYFKPLALGQRRLPLGERLLELDPTTHQRRLALAQGPP